MLLEHVIDCCGKKKKQGEKLKTQDCVLPLGLSSCDLAAVWAVAPLVHVVDALKDHLCYR